MIMSGGNSSTFPQQRTHRPARTNDTSTANSNKPVGLSTASVPRQSSRPGWRQQPNILRTRVGQHQSRSTDRDNAHLRPDLRQGVWVNRIRLCVKRTSRTLRWTTSALLRTTSTQPVMTTQHTFYPFTDEAFDVARDMLAVVCFDNSGRCLSSAAWSWNIKPPTPKRAARSSRVVRRRRR